MHTFWYVNIPDITTSYSRKNLAFDFIFIKLSLILWIINENNFNVSFCHMLLHVMEVCRTASITNTYVNIYVYVSLCFGYLVLESSFLNCYSYHFNIYWFDSDDGIYNFYDSFYCFMIYLFFTYFLQNALHLKTWKHSFWMTWSII